MSSQSKTTRSIGQMSFGKQSNALFAQLSGDFNPVHLDVIWSRRTQAGAPIVHGMHSLLWALECLAKAQTGLPALTRLKVQFKTPIYVGDPAVVEVLEVTSVRCRMRVVVEGASSVLITVSFRMQSGALALPSIPQSASLPWPKHPASLELHEMEAYSGCLPCNPLFPEIDGMFPHASLWLGSRKITTLARCSSLVGMVVPGMQSIFTGVDISFLDDVVFDTNELNFSVTSVDPRFRLVRIAIRGCGASGSLEAVSPPPPVKQLRMARAIELIQKGQFRGSTALIVGGSRGLGELTAKLVSAGGARTIITYANGRADATSVLEDICRAGAHCEAISYDVSCPAAEQLQTLAKSAPTHLYYFATPLIARRKTAAFDSQHLAKFNSFYITGFFELVRACLALRPQGIDVFFPSTTFIDDRPPNMTEYAMSKAAAEILCSDLQTYMPAVRVLARRLPRVLTDQNNLWANDIVDPIEVMLPIVLEMHPRGR